MWSAARSLEVLDQLAARGILERLGALSYRFRLMLLSDWLRERLDLPKLARNTRWSQDRERLPAEQPPEPPARPGLPGPNNRPHPPPKRTSRSSLDSAPGGRGWRQ